VSAKHQVTLPIDALREAGIQTGEVILVRDMDPVEQFRGALPDVYPAGGLDELRREWD
jgi:hypothetical protein